MNRIYELEEGRPVWKLRPLQLLLTLAGLLVVAARRSCWRSADRWPLPSATRSVWAAALTVWNIARWPAFLVLVTLAVAILYYATRT